MTQYTHKYKPSPFCNNCTDANGVQKIGTCSHTAHFELPHCMDCGREHTHSVHQVPKETI